MGKLTQHAGNFADFGCGDSTRWIMAGFAAPIMEKGKRGDRCWSLGREFGGAYCINLDQNRDLMFTAVSEKGSMSEHPALILPRDEIRDLIEGIFMQSSMGLGRTSIKQLSDIISRRFSPDFIAGNAQEEAIIAGLVAQNA